MKTANACQIKAVGKRRDGGTRFWCVQHRADATAKYGKRAARCRYAHIPAVAHGESIRLSPSKFAGGIAVWGAVPPVYDTTRLPIDRGIHVHARSQARSRKEIDQTYREVEIQTNSGLFVLSELDAIYFMVSSVFGYEVKYVECTYCHYPHLDKDWFSVHTHRRHLCSGCGRTFSDVEQGVGNPIARIRGSFPDRVSSRLSSQKLKIKQSEFPGGIQIWGSNPAIVWTSSTPEEEGIHVHTYSAANGDPTIDDTFSTVEIDGVKLDSTSVRLLMAQSALPHIFGRVVALHCLACGNAVMDTGSEAFTPKSNHRCDSCGTLVRSMGRLRNVISNSIVRTLAGLAAKAPRVPQTHDLALLPETI